MRILLLSLGLIGSVLGQSPEGEPRKKKGPPPVPEGVRVLRDVVYASPGGIDLALDLYLPEAKAEAPLPVIVWVHGGGWKNGSKDRCPGAPFAAEGFAVASINYRLIDQAIWPAQIQDCFAAVRWLRRNAAEHGLDPDRIGAWGGSAGGHLAALMGTLPRPADEAVSSAVQAVCDWYGPSDLLTMPPNTIGNGRTREQVEQSNGAKLLGATVMDVPELAKQVSAYHQASAGDAPFLIMHGSEDPGVPVVQSEKLHQALTKAGVRSELIVVEGAGHGGPDFKTPEVLGQVRAFFAREFGVAD